MARKKINLDEVSQGSEHLINNQDEDNKKMTQIIFKCSELQKENIKKNSKKKGLTVSGYIKNLIALDGGLD